MKLMIEIPEEVYKTVQDGSYCGSLYEELKAAIPYNPSGDLISREALKNDIEEKVCDKFERWNKTITCAEFETFIRDVIDNAPTIEFPSVINMKPLTAEEKQGLIDALKKSRLKVVKLDDIEGIRGEWIVIHNALGETKYQCNRCQHYVKPSDDKNFCPNCGADMRKGEWIPNKGNGYSNSGRHCSLCGENVEFSEPVCPGCRAQMKIGGDNA